MLLLYGCAYVALRETIDVQPKNVTTNLGLEGYEQLQFNWLHA